ncbi:RND family efflux transporter MFP subunit [Tenacibaculum litopenaei]|uniref:efflux RND transporter periplasmic adaptor subunit n=1 Tax=Tenacibaculum litopenaei TaxID=396016 RepID=UPI0038934E59
MMKRTAIKGRFIILTATVIAILTAISLAFTNKKEEKSPSVHQKPMAVKTAKPLFEKIKEWDEYTGRFEASNQVAVRARVNGYIEKVNFKDGQIVNKGDVLFIIDQRSFKIELRKAMARYEQILTVQKQAQDNFNRVQSLKESGAVSLEEYDRRAQALAAAKANVQLAEATVAAAELNLEFTKVKAPIKGRVGRDFVNRGNLINGGTANATLLTTIVTTNPIYFYFSESEADFLKYTRRSKNGKTTAMRTVEQPVLIKLQDETSYQHKGEMDFIDNQIDRNTGTIEGRAILENDDYLLEPGMFGKAKIEVSDEHEAIMIPDEVIGTNQSVRFVYVVTKENKVKSVNVELGPLHSNGLRIIRKGLSPNDVLIINNIQKIRPGMTIAPTASSLTE